jgi:electron transfer flavoprotein alpha subunit
MRSNNKDVMVYVEVRHNNIQNVGLELIGKARDLADVQNSNVIAVVLGKEITEEQAKDLVAYGADEVIVANHDLLATYVNESYTKVLTDIMTEINVDSALFGASAIGRDLAPRISARLHTGLTADCTGLEVDLEKEQLLMTRPAFGGNLFATIICPDHKPQMASVRPGVMQKKDRDEARTGNIINWDVELDSSSINYEVIEEVVVKTEKKNIEEANILVSAGRGVGSPENVEKLHDLADNLGAMVSGSRAVVDAGWIEHHQQVGQTGKTVRPEVYFALGISGAIQHVAGMEESDLIIAINKNPDAPIFEVADLGFVGDVNQIIPELTKSLQAVKDKKTNLI